MKKLSAGEGVLVITHLVVIGGSGIMLEAMEPGAASGLFLLPFIALGICGYGLGLPLAVSRLGTDSSAIVP